MDLVQETKPAKTRCEEEEESPNHPKLLVGRLYLEALDYAGLSKGILNTHHHLYPVLKTVSSSHHHSRRAGSTKIAFLKILKDNLDQGSINQAGMYSIEFEDKAPWCNRAKEGTAERKEPLLSPFTAVQGVLALLKLLNGGNMRSCTAA